MKAPHYLLFSVVFMSEKISFSARVLLCFRSRMSTLQQDQTLTPRRSPGATKGSVRRGRPSATVNPESRDSLALRDQRYRLTSPDHFILNTHFKLLFDLLTLMKKHMKTFIVLRLLKNTDWPVGGAVYFIISS